MTKHMTTMKPAIIRGKFLNILNEKNPPDFESGGLLLILKLIQFK